MTNRRFILALVCILISFNLLSQKQANIWYFGEGAGLDFNTVPPTPIAGGQVFANPQNDMEFVHNEGCSSIADSTGTLLFYTNGEKVWNANNQVMPNGEGLMGMYSSTHAAFIVPQPLSDSLFYIFTTDGLERNLEDGLRYSLVHMCADNGLGDVVIDQKNLLLLDLVSEKLTAITHENGEDIWLIAHKFNSDAFYAFPVTSDGIGLPVVTNIGSIHQGNGSYSAIGQMKSSQDGNKIALVFSNVNPSVAEIFDFDKATGTLSNHISLTSTYNEYGVEFSPDNSKLYVSSLAGTFQFDLNAGSGTQSDINSSRIQIPMDYTCIPSGMQLGPDGKIYVNRCSSFIGVIHNPNASGVACDFEDNYIQFQSGYPSVTFPSFMPFGEYKNEVYSCEEVSGIDDPLSTNTFSIFPNPSKDIVFVRFYNSKNKPERLTIINVQGQIVNQYDDILRDDFSFSVSNLSQGFYTIMLNNTNGTSIVKKLLVE